jgi:nucleolar protein TMA23
MSFNSTTFLTTQGWEGAGVPLDGKGGKGLKKPLAIPQKRGLKGLGKERDRAVEWWDCLFEVSAPGSASMKYLICRRG